MTNFDALILSAGFGERLRPITYSIPKVLLPVLGKPLLFRIIDKVKAYSPECIFVNLHYLADKIKEYVSENYGDVRFVFEPKIMGTGGGLWNVAQMSSSENILVHNGDIYTDFDFDAFLKFHENSGYEITLAINNRVPKKNLVVNGSLLTNLSDEGNSGFAGVAVYKVSFLRDLGFCPFDAKEIWLYCIEKGGRVGVFDTGQSYWADIGKPEDYACLIFSLLKRLGENLYLRYGERFYPEIKFDGYLVIDGEPDIEKGCFFRNVIIVGNPKIKRARYGNLIISPAGVLSFGEIRAFGGQGQIYEVGFGGSDRKFLRVFASKSSTFVRCSFGNDKEGFEKYLMGHRLLEKCGIDVAEIYKVDVENLEIEMEDLGDITLYTFLKYPANMMYEEDFYKKGIEFLARLHALGKEQTESKYFDKWKFDMEYFLWEQEHFFRNFVERVLELKVEDSVKIILASIAERAANFPWVIVHRDFQSQNLMVDQQSRLRVIDFAGMRWGPKTYDLASFLYDPYRKLSEDLRQKLLRYYVFMYNNLASERIREEDLKEELKYTRVQRHLQALGAYGYLSKVKGKSFFEKFFISGVKYLLEDIDSLLPRDDGLNEFAGLIYEKLLTLK
ncbi:MAG: phosphotransferase [candidate division WOR-3 bacterium]